ncbi:MAG: 30S ribosomal protein S4 [Candidatus Liptonbacteria bacterium CG11_big_fil_rev_8_21_14_0_20_35_14]|uniref:Small ribosomal subunit protein uS4 n=1 Tax=Candidatus Liptonbacteria bacterium CG11_big_fil_rev_8_21_14_0_20_35_14 TaxID=1974634 RepID=A0A2H0N7F7_9BACT|nr:MAG: 30S ribosomal protein S4 [Candidatus Liptonbacteria bacterium CG11_big_fil_rev_8_21_14_0_20_35_14]
MRGPKEKIERALGERLGLKAERSLSPKSAMVKRPYKPGQHGNSKKRSNISDFGLQLKEKQKFKVIYGLKEKQLKEIFAKAIKSKEVTRDKVFEILERRLDNAVFRLGLAGSRNISRQMVLHGHVSVNTKKVTYPAFEVSVNDIISISSNSRELTRFANLKEKLKKQNSPFWLLLDSEKLEGKIVSLPKEVDVPFDVNLVVEYYSK